MSKKRTAQEKLHHRHWIELWADRWNHTGAMVRTVVGVLGLIGMLVILFTR